jgi:hypothetical protein
MCVFVNACVYAVTSCTVILAETPDSAKVLSSRAAPNQPATPTDNENERPYWMEVKNHEKIGEYCYKWMLTSR